MAPLKNRPLQFLNFALRGFRFLKDVSACTMIFDMIVSKACKASVYYVYAILCICYTMHMLYYVYTILCMYYTMHSFLTNSVYTTLCTVSCRCAQRQSLPLRCVLGVYASELSIYIHICVCVCVCVYIYTQRQSLALCTPAIAVHRGRVSQASQVCIRCVFL